MAGWVLAVCSIVSFSLPSFRKPAECKQKWAQKTIQSSFLGTHSAPIKLTSETPIKQGVKEADKSSREWFVVAGGLPGFSAPVPDGPGCKWEGGEYERIEAKNHRTKREPSVARK